MFKTTAVLLIALCLIQLNMGKIGKNSSQKRNSVYECYKREKVHSKRSAMDYIKGNWSLAEERPALKCFSACNMKVWGALKGCTLLYRVMRKRALADNNKALSDGLEACKDSAKGNDRCECGHEVFKCFFEYKKALKNSLKFDMFK